jgi:hypothetical protein
MAQTGAAAFFSSAAGVSEKRHSRHGSKKKHSFVVFLVVFYIS